MENLSQLNDFISCPTEDSIILICVFRDEELIIDAFIKHYKSLKVSHFIFIDNGSEDYSCDILYANMHGIDYQLWRATGRYSENDYGLAWVNFILETEVRNMWCIVVDLDEFLILEGHANLRQLVDCMNREDKNITHTCLVDFYPRVFHGTAYVSGSPPVLHSSFYDKFENEYIKCCGRVQDIYFQVYGGLRKRVAYKLAKEDGPMLNKKSFFKNIFYEKCGLGPGMHFFYWKDGRKNVLSNSPNCKQFKFFGVVQALAHFKYLRSDIDQYFSLRVLRNEDWNNSSEYKQYLSDGLASSFYDETISQVFRSTGQLYSKTVHLLPS